MAQLIFPNYVLRLVRLLWIIMFFADTWMIDASNQLPILAYGAQIVPEASPKSTGFPTALAVVAALALVKPRQPGICEATTHSQL